MIRFLKVEASSISSLVGLRSTIETMVWLHSCLDGYSCIFYDECLRNCWYGCIDLICIV
jgi:hypothetical protein